MWMKFRLLDRRNIDGGQSPIVGHINLMAKAITQKNFSNRPNLGFYKRGSFVVTHIADGLKCVIFPIHDSELFAAKILTNEKKTDFSAVETIVKLVRHRMIAINDTVANNEKHPPMMITSGKDQSGGSTLIAFFADPQLWGDQIVIEAQSVSIESKVLKIGMQLFQSNQSRLTIAWTNNDTINKSFEAKYEDLPVTVPLFQQDRNDISFSPSYSYSYSSFSKKRSLDDDYHTPMKRLKGVDAIDDQDNQSDEESSDQFCMIPPSSPSNDSVFSVESINSDSDDDLSLPSTPMMEDTDELVRAKAYDGQSVIYQQKPPTFYSNTIISHQYKKEIDDHSNFFPCPSPPLSSQIAPSSSVDNEIHTDSKPCRTVLLNASDNNPSNNINEQSECDDEWQAPYIDNEAENAIMKNYRPPCHEVSDDHDRDVDASSIDLSDDDFDLATVVGTIPNRCDDATDDSLFF